MDELEANFFVGLSIHFGGPKKPYMSGTAGVGVTRNFKNFSPGANVAVNFYNGGIGSLSNNDSFNIDTVITAKLTAGSSATGGPMTINPLHLNSGSGLEDNRKFSATIGTNFIVNNNNRNQQVAFLQLRANDFSFQTYNDFQGAKKIGLSDGYDRWWTGGGNFTIGNNNSPYQLVIASDVFTADTDSNNKIDSQNAQSNLNDFKANHPKYLDRLKSRISDYTPATAREVDQAFLDEFRDGTKWTSEQHSFDLNQGRTSFRLKTPQGSVGLNSLGESNMYSQDGIHRLINFHLIPSERPNYWEIQNTATFEKQF